MWRLRSTASDVGHLILLFWGVSRAFFFFKPASPVGAGRRRLSQRVGRVDDHGADGLQARPGAGQGGAGHEHRPAGGEDEQAGRQDHPREGREQR